MASAMLLFMCFVTILVLDEIPGRDSTNFPLDNCTTDEMDIIELYLIDSTYSLNYSQNLWGKIFGYGDFVRTGEKTMSRVRYVKVKDGFDYHNNEVNVSSWGFHSVEEDSDPQEIEAEPYMYLTLKTAQEIMDMKMMYVQRLFSEMRGVRENATHVAIIFIEDAHFSDDEIKNISHIGQHRNTKFKSFFVILSERHTHSFVHLNDSIILSSRIYEGFIYIEKYLYMAICKLCSPGWFSYEHNDSADYLSCYKLLQFEAASCYNERADWASVDTLDEMTFLQTRLYWEIKKIKNRTNYKSNSSQVLIGLLRDEESTARRFKWLKFFTESSLSFRPLLINHWMPGKPTGVRGKECAVWQYTDIRKDDNNNNDMFQAFSRYKDRYVEGWMDVTCNFEFQELSLCEINLPRRVIDENIIRIKPANKKSFNDALKNENFMIFDGNIVSVSAYVSSFHFLEFLKETERDFPIFDCGEDAGLPRYISYTFVCDYVDHCTNRRDEMSCLAPHEMSRFAPCDSGETLSYVFDVCDDVNDCQDGSDETNCNAQCTGKQCTDGYCSQIQWLNDGESDCIISQDVNDENVVHNPYLKRNETCALICNKGKTCVNLSQLNDNHTDCVGAEGPLDETIGKLEPANTCYNLLGHVIWAPKCVYIKDRYGAVLGCRNMSHLQDCMDYQCVEGYVKCYKSYCIPQHYVLDGQADCPTGEEEEDLNTGSCSGNFACWDSKVCLHPDLVCNRYPDCPHKDDELNCDASCPDGFRCVAGTVTVSDYNTSVPLENLHHRTKYLDLSGLDVSRPITYDHFFILELYMLNLSKRKLDSLSSTISHYLIVTHTLDISFNLLKNFTGNHSGLRHIRHLNLSYNKNLVLVKNLHFSQLEVIDLSHTGLTYLHDTLFRRLPNLRRLNLSYSFIVVFNKNMFPTHFMLQTLDLRGLAIENFYEDLFGDLIINQDLYTDKFEICCPQIRGIQIPHHACHAPDDAISSCFDLVRVNVQRVLLWVVAVLAVLGNMTVIVYRVIWDRSVLKTGYGLFVTNLGISDLIMGVYLFIIAGADYYYRDNYVLYQNNWRKSVVCKIASFLATLSGETSKLFILLITLDRFLVIKFPFGQIKFSKVSTRITILFSWCTGFILSLLPTVFMFKIYSSNAMCLGLLLTNKRLSGWEYSFGIFVVVNFLMCLTIAYGQMAIFRAMSDNRITRTASTTSASRQIEDIIVAKRLFLVVLSDFLCWFPVGVMGLLSLGGYEINNDVYAWTVVLVLPINSAVNPLLYTMSALIARWEKFKNGQRMPR